jgi:hypothetical protein
VSWDRLLDPDARVATCNALRGVISMEPRCGTSGRLRHRISRCVCAGPMIRSSMSCGD